MRKRAGQLLLGQHGRAIVAVDAAVAIAVRNLSNRRVDRMLAQSFPFNSIQLLRCNINSGRRYAF